ncbi:glutathione peroxidase [Psychrobacillus psychrotolerans]|uniref:glutathione peroxidase n=1 Tax=Psychrobacillus psychrotolerans TaxID=126156 RepID=UPI003B010416
MSIYNYQVKKPNGDILSMETYKDKVMLICNTASQCEFTYQYEDLQKLYERQLKDGFTVLSFPCDQFGNQNPEDGVQTAAQCKLQFGVSYPVFDKINVNGDNTHPLFNYLKHEIDAPEIEKNTFQQKMLFENIEKYYPEFLIGNNIRWNFTKFLVDRKGKVVARFEPDASMVDIQDAIKALL